MSTTLDQGSEVQGKAALYYLRYIVFPNENVARIKYGCSSVRLDSRVDETALKSFTVGNRHSRRSYLFTLSSSDLLPLRQACNLPRTPPSGG